MRWRPATSFSRDRTHGRDASPRARRPGRTCSRPCRRSLRVRERRHRGHRDARRRRGRRPGRAAGGRPTLAHPMQRLQVQLLRGLGRHELHRRALHGFGNRFGIVEVVLLSLAIGADIFGRHQPGIVTKRCEFSAQVMCAKRRLPCRSGKAGYLASRASTWPRDHFCRSTMAPRRIVAHNVERVLANIDADHGDRTSRNSGTWRAPCL